MSSPLIVLSGASLELDGQDQQDHGLGTTTRRSCDAVIACCRSGNISISLETFVVWFRQFWRCQPVSSPVGTVGPRLGGWQPAESDTEATGPRWRQATCAPRRFLASQRCCSEGMNRKFVRRYAQRPSGLVDTGGERLFYAVGDLKGDPISHTQLGPHAPLQRSALAPRRPTRYPNRSFRFGVRRGLLWPSLKSEGSRCRWTVGAGSLRLMVSMRRAGPIVMHHWIATARGATRFRGAPSPGNSASAEQTAHERFSRPAREVQGSPLRAFSASVQVARGLASQPYADPDEDPWALPQSGLWNRLPPRDEVDLGALDRVVVAVEEELAWLVAEARCRGGMTWEALGQALGEVSRQAAQKRFGGPVSMILYGWDRF